MLRKRLIKENFSRYAKYYDRYADIQHLCALTLIDKIKQDGFEEILDVGCGTGDYTKILKDRFPVAKIQALDISDEMVQIAKGKLEDRKIDFFVGDGEIFEFNRRFDLITSNACFHWFEDLETTLKRYGNLLNKGGLISFSVFGPLTFQELRISLEKLYTKEITITASNFIEKDEWEKILGRYFKESSIEEEIFRKRCSSLLELLKKIAYTGTGGIGIGKSDQKSETGRGLWTIGKINELEAIYRAAFGEIQVTYQVFFCHGVK